VLGAYRDPFGGKSVLIVSLPIDKVEPTPFQRDPSDPHVKRLMTVIETLDRFSTRSSSSAATTATGRPTATTGCRR
jgi:hypothetical protein